MNPRLPGTKLEFVAQIYPFILLNIFEVPLEASIEVPVYILEDAAIFEPFYPADRCMGYAIAVGRLEAIIGAEGGASFLVLRTEPVVGGAALEIREKGVSPEFFSVERRRILTAVECHLVEGAVRQGGIVYFLRVGGDHLESQ